MARASDSKSGGWGFESLLACVEFLNGFKWFLNGEQGDSVFVRS